MGLIDWKGHDLYAQDEPLFTLSISSFVDQHSHLGSMQ